MPDPTTCEIHIREVLDQRWATTFTPLVISVGPNETILSGEVQDQAELFGILIRIRDCGLTLVSLTPVEPGMK